MKNLSPSVTIIGTGAVGTALADLFSRHGYELRSVWNSRFGRVISQDGTESLVPKNIPAAGHEIGELLFITTPDDLISEVAAALAGTSINWGGKYVVHCSGNLSSEECSVLQKKGAFTASMHPIQTFRKGDIKDHFKGIYVSVEGDKQVVAILLPIIKLMGASPLQLRPDQKRDLHIAAVFGSNYLVALLHQTEKLLQEAQLKDGLKILEPIIRQTVENVFEKGTVNSLTGPVSRGDAGSVKKHIGAFKTDEQSKAIYKIMGTIALDITKKRGDLSIEKIDEIEKLIKIEK